jgi:hypothetical protein
MVNGSPSTRKAVPDLVTATAAALFVGTAETSLELPLGPRTLVAVASGQAPNASSTARQPAK